MKLVGDKLINYICDRFEEDNCDDRYYDDLFNFGIYPLKTDKVGKQTPDTIIKRMETHYPFNFTHLSNGLRRVDGAIAGSYPLQCYINEYWKGSDIDIYINYDNFVKKYLDKNSDFVINWNKGIINRNKYDKLPFTVDKLEKYMIYLLFNNDINITNLKVRMYKQREGIFKIDNSGDMNKEFPNIYGAPQFLSVVIKFDATQEDKTQSFDIVLVNTTARYFVRSFDFDFNKIFYDGYGLYMYYEESILNKSSLNHYLPDRYNVSNLEKYKNNMLRIRKYMKRGFFIYKQ